MRDSRTDLELISRDGKLQTWKYYKDHNTDAMGGIDATTTKVNLIPFKFRLPLIFASRGQKLKGANLKPLKLRGERNLKGTNMGILY